MARGCRPTGRRAARHRNDLRCAFHSMWIAPGRGGACGTNLCAVCPPRVSHPPTSSGAAGARQGAPCRCRAARQSRSRRAYRPIREQARWCMGPGLVPLARFAGERRRDDVEESDLFDRQAGRAYRVLPSLCFVKADRANDGEPLHAAYLRPPRAVPTMGGRLRRRDVDGAIRLPRADGRAWKESEMGSRSRRPTATVSGGASAMAPSRRPPRGTWPDCNGVRPAGSDPLR